MKADSLRSLRNFSDIVHGTIVYNGFEELVLSTPLLLRLQRISQNSLAFLTFPSNKVKRFEHSIGVMHLASRYFRSALINTNKEDLVGFFDNIKESLNTWISSIKNDNRTEYQSAYDSRLFGVNGSVILKKFVTLKKDLLTDNKFFDMQIPSNIEDKYYVICASLFQGLRLAGLLHDLGHLPYSHTLECVLKKLYIDINCQTQKTKLEKTYIDLFDRYCKTDRALHEELSKYMLNVVEREVALTIGKLEDNDGTLKFYALLSLVSFEIARNILYNKESTLYCYLHSIISGVVDADRLDYASRDLLCSAVSKDVINYDRLFNHCAIHKDQENECYTVAFDVKAIHDIEDFLKKRWRIYRVINYHHSVLKSETIMRRTLRQRALKTLRESTDVFVDTSDECIVSKCSTSLPNDFIFGIMLVLYHLEEDGDTETLIKILLMLDDSWLDTLMKRTDNNSGLDNELVNGRKIYKTILKRYSDFLEFDEMVYNKFLCKIKDLKRLADVAQENQDQENPSINSDTIQNNQLVDEIHEFLEVLDFELVDYNHYIIDQTGTLFSNSLLNIVEQLFSVDESTRESSPMEIFESIFSSNVEDEQKRFLGIVSFGTGIPDDDSYKLWNPKKENLIGLTMYSSIKFDLECERESIPPFCLYALVNEDESSVLNQLCEVFVNFITDYISEYLEKSSKIV